MIENIYILGIANDFLNRTKKAIPIEEKFENWDFIKIKKKTTKIF